jgi:hypothetical protein
MSSIGRQSIRSPQVTTFTDAPTRINDHPKGLPIVIKGDGLSVEATLLAVSIILILIFCCWIMTLIRSGPTSQKAYFECPSSECATNIYNGEKRCPADGVSIILYDPAYEVCNSQYTCENVETPYALWSDGSTNIYGICEPNNACRCLRQPQCATYTLVMFTMLNGSIYLGDNNDQRFVFQQNPLSSMAALGTQQVGFTNSNTQFCAIKPYHMNRISPGGCAFLDNTINHNSYVNGIAQCMHDTNPCMLGTIAFVPPNMRDFIDAKTAVINEFPVACVPGPNPCSAQELPAFDSTQGIITCVPGPSKALNSTSSH